MNSLTIIILVVGRWFNGVVAVVMVVTVVAGVVFIGCCRSRALKGQEWSECGVLFQF